jgi:hypothetical protein
MKERANTYTTGLAAEYLIMSCLIRQGYEVYLTIGNMKKTDIRVICPRTNTTRSVDVKAVRGYSSLVVNNVKTSVDHIVVFVIFNSKLEDPEYMPDIFIVPSLEVESITSHFKKEKRVMKNVLEKYKSKWEIFQQK